MTSIVQKLNNSKLITPPDWLPRNVHYEVMTGSIAYGVSTDMSDIDVIGFCMPPIKTIFPHLNGDIPGFGKQKQPFNQYLQHHIKDPSNGKEYDLTIYSIVKYFHLCMDNNPNMIDSLFVPRRCIIHTTQVGERLRENRRLFLHKGCWHKFKGYAYSQLHKMKGKAPEAGSKRQELREKYGFDVKFAYHVVRLLSQAEQILSTGDLDLQEKSRREHMKAIRRGDVSEQDIIDWAASKEKYLEKLYETSDLQYRPNEQKIKNLLIECIEMHYGSIDKMVVKVAAEQETKSIKAIQEIKRIIDNYGT